MSILIACSAFFSASEAALFYLRPQERQALSEGTSSQRSSAALLQDPDRLLSAVLFWNLLVNMAYFAVTSIVHLKLEKHGPSMAFMFTACSVLTIIFFSEMLPKSLGVLIPQKLSGWFGWPLSASVRAVDPLLPLLRTVNVLSQRLIWPNFQAETALETADLERAIELSIPDADLVEQEQAVLRNVVLLSDIQVNEWMRPRTQFVSFRPPVRLADLEGQMTPSGYLLITERDSEEVASAIHLKELAHLPSQHLEHQAAPVVYVPWCSTVAYALDEMQGRDREVAAIVNELGETIGILTFEDIMDTLFSYSPSRSKLLLDRKPIHDIGTNSWLVAGVTSLRRLERYLKIKFPPSKSVTVAGVLQESMQRLAEAGDQCDWGPFHFRVLEAAERGHMLIELTYHPKQRSTS